MLEFSGLVRDATPADHPAFVRLFPELGVDDPILDQDRFTREIVPTAVVAIRDDETVGYAYFRVLGDTAHVVHVITAPNARRSGVGTAIMRAIADRITARGCTGWYLNTFPTNEPAKALYASLGFTPSFTSQAIKVPWSSIEATPPREGVVARPFDASEDAAIERTLDLHSGQLAAARALGNRVLMVLLENGAIAGVASFDPSFPGINPFRVTRPDLAMHLLAALRPHARPNDDLVHAVVENRPDIGEALLSAGASLRLTSLRMNGPLPIPR
jgi:GNAT superfamily N-acetyltransferase